MLGMSTLKVRDLNEHVTCAICGGYFVDATTIIECLHSFCRSCIVTHMMINRFCPKCEVPAHKTRPLLNIRSDKTLQDIVYKLVPNLLDKEKARKRRFHEDMGIPMDAEDEKQDSVVLTPEKKDHRVSLSVEYDPRELNLSADSKWIKEGFCFPKRYLRCYDAVFISTINKLVRMKLGREDLEVLSFCRGEVLPESYTLSDVASTFSWKSDRPLSLTYMTFSAKGTKRKLPSPIQMEDHVQEVVPPAKKLAAASAAETCIATATEIVEPKRPEPQPILPAETTKPNPQPEPSTVDATTSIPNDVNTLLPNSNSATWKPNAGIHQVSKPTQQVTGVKVSPYAVRNQPFVTVTTSDTTKQQGTTSPSIPPSVDSSSVTKPNHSVQSQTQSSAPLPTPQGKVKSINSIANRLQMEKVKLAPNKTESYPIVNVPDSVKVNSNSANSAMVEQPQSSWTTNEAVVNARRNMMAQRINSTAFRSQGFKDEPIRRPNILARKDVRPTASSLHGPSARDARLPQSSAPNHGNFVRFGQPSSSNPPNYSQATDQRNKIRMAQAAQQRHLAMRPKFHEMQRTLQAQARADHQQSITQQQHHPRRKNVPRTDDPQLLTTTMQLASLREQQKLLNEIAAAVSARNSNPHSTDSIRAAMSNLSPKASSTRITSQTASVSTVRKHIPIAMMPPVNRGPVRPTTPVNAGVIKVPGMQDSNGRSNGGSPRVNGSKMFNEASQSSKDMGYPSMNKRRDGGIDIYQNTIARAKAQVREMNMKDRTTVHHQRTQIRAAISPYNVQNRNTVRQHSAPYRPPSYQNYMQRTSPSTSSAAPMNQLRRPGPGTYRGVTTKPPPPPHPSQRFTPSNVFHNSMANRQIRPPPPPPASHARIPTAVKQADAGLPEQDQPLCLVVKK